MSCENRLFQAHWRRDFDLRSTFWRRRETARAGLAGKGSGVRIPDAPPDLELENGAGKASIGWLGGEIYQSRRNRCGAQRLL
jgi:hypothetical protein